MAYSKKSPGRIAHEATVKARASGDPEHHRVAANLHHEASREAHSKAAEATGIGKADQAQSWNSRAMEHRDMEVHHNAKSGPAPKIQTESKGVKLRAFAEQGKGADPIAQSRKASRAASQKGAASASVKQAESKLAKRGAAMQAGVKQQQASKLSTNDPKHHELMAEHHALLGNKEQASQHANKAAKLAAFAKSGKPADLGIGKAGPASPAHGRKGARLKAFAEQGNAPSGATRGRNLNIAQQNAMNLTSKAYKSNTAEAHKAAASAHELVSKAADNEGYSRASTHHLGRAGEHHGKVAELAGNKDQAQHHATKAKQLTTEANRRQKLSDQIAEERFQRGHGGGGMGDAGIGKAGPASPAHGRLEAARAKLGKASKSESEWLGKMRGIISAKRDVRAVERKKGPTAPIQTSARGAKYYTNKSGEKVYVK